MADDEDNGYGSGGTIAGSLVGAAVGVALISNPAGVLGMLGVGTTAPAAAGGMMAATLTMAPIAAVGGAGALAIGLAVVGLVAAGALIGRMVSKHYHNKAREKQAAIRSVEAVHQQAVAAEASVPVQERGTSQWRNQVEQSRAQPAPAPGQHSL